MTRPPSCKHPFKMTQDHRQ